MILVIDNGDLHDLLRVLFGAIRSGDWEGSQERALDLLGRVVVAARAGDEGLQSFLVDTLGEVPSQVVDSGHLNALTEAIVEQGCVR